MNGVYSQWFINPDRTTCKVSVVIKSKIIFTTPTRCSCFNYNYVRPKSTQ